MTQPELSDTRLLEFSRRLQFANDYDAMLNDLCREVREATGYQTAWIGVYLPEHNTFKILTLQAKGTPVEWDTADEIPVADDPYLSRLLEDRAVAIVEDAQIDPNVNREIVTELGNRTIVNLPMSFGDAAFGALGTGTFGDEGVRLPTAEQLDYLQKLTSTVTAASVRILKLEQRRLERRAMSATLLDELNDLVAAIEADAAALPEAAGPAGRKIAERAHRAAKLVEHGRSAIAINHS
ncbi:MAG: GAF domain-containing protein [Actinobacteria bacterium]|nr:GAF domain-containing protein [Actinomycetota bacterium]